VVEPLKRRSFCLERETGQRGAKPESNQIHETEDKLIQQKKEKIIQIFKNNTDIREMIVSRDTNPRGLDLSSIIDTLFEDQHFKNCKYLIFD